MSEILKTKIDQNERSAEIPETRSTAETVLELGAVAMRFARVDRVPRYEDGERESDAEHSFMLSLVATELSYQLYPDMFDHGKVSQYAIVHDLIELKTGDVSTFGISAGDLANKEKAEHQALSALLEELPPFTRQMLAAYERQADPESRFVRAIDKLLPLVVDIIGQGRRVMEEDHGISDLTALHECQAAVHQRMQDRFGEFPQVLKDHVLLSDLFADVFEATR
jgi:putative hydrolases of HD superfamily